MTLKSINNSLKHRHASRCQSAKQMRRLVFTGEGCGKLALKKHLCEVFCKEEKLAVSFVSNYEQ